MVPYLLSCNVFGSAVVFLVLFCSVVYPNLCHLFNCSGVFVFALEFPYLLLSFLSCFCFAVVCVCV